MAQLEAEVGGLRETETRLRDAMDTEREGARLVKDALSQEKAEVQDELDRLKVDMEAVAEAQEVLEGRANGKAFTRTTVQQYNSTGTGHCVGVGVGACVCAQACTCVRMCVSVSIALRCVCCDARDSPAAFYPRLQHMN